MRGALALAQGHTQAEPAGRFFYELFLAHDKPWALVRGAPSARKLAKRRKLLEGGLSTERGDLVELARRGARNIEDSLVLLTFAMVGAREVLGDAPQEALTDFAQRLLQLQLATGIDVQPLVVALLNDAQRAALYDGVAASIVAPAAQGRPAGVSLAERATRIAAVLWLFSTQDPAADPARKRVNAVVTEPGLRVWWEAGRGSAQGPSEVLSLESAEAQDSPLFSEVEGAATTTASSAPFQAAEGTVAAIGLAVERPQAQAPILQTNRTDLEPAVSTQGQRSEPVVGVAGEASAEHGSAAACELEPDSTGVEPTLRLAAQADMTVPEPDRVMVGELMSRPPPGRCATYGRLVSGWALLQGAARAIAWTLGLRRHGRFVLREERLLVASETRLFGVTTSQTHALFARSQWESARVTVRQPIAGHLLGLSALALASYVGGLLLIDGALLGHYALLVAGGLVVGGGALCEGLLFLGTSRVRLRGVVELHVAGQRWWLRRVPAAQAQRWFAALQVGRPARGVPPCASAGARVEEGEVRAIPGG